MIKSLENVQSRLELAQKAQWSASNLAKLLNISLRTLERYFLKEMGTTPKTWLATQRQMQAVRLLRNGARVKEVAGLLNYKHPSHLTNQFRRYWGYYPTERNRVFPNA